MIVFVVLPSVNADFVIKLADRIIKYFKLNDSNHHLE